ncbi:MAG TPA: hypothetical protein VK404_01745 [Spirosoma sp.]|nr:hypothetical protein [Spirosoma sp.]
MAPIDPHGCAIAKAEISAIGIISGWLALQLIIVGGEGDLVGQGGFGDAPGGDLPSPHVGGLAQRGPQEAACKHTQ